MSRLLGIVNPDKTPEDEHNHWLWRADSNVIPAAAEWDYERLAIYSTPAPDGNVCVWVTGPPTERYRDGVFLKMFVSVALNPRPRTTDDLQLAAKLNEEVLGMTILAPLADMR